MKRNISYTTATILGVAALLIWNTLFAFMRSLAEQLGPLTAPAAIYLLAGTFGCVYVFAKGGLGAFKKFPKKYLLICGGSFVTYMVSIQLAVGWAANRQQTMEVMLINYLWPALTMAFFVPILKYRARIWLIPGIVIAMTGIALTITSGSEFSWELLWQNLCTNFLPYGLAAASAVAWAIYSNFSRVFASQISGNATPLFLLACGLIFGACSAISAEHSVVHLTTVFELLYMAIFPCLLAYVFWDVMMRRGNALLLASISYLQPLLSTLLSALYLHVAIGRQLWAACVLIISGAVICKFSVVPAQEPAANLPGGDRDTVKDTCDNEHGCTACGNRS